MCVCVCVCVCVCMCVCVAFVCVCLCVCVYVSVRGCFLVFGNFVLTATPGSNCLCEDWRSCVLSFRRLFHLVFLLVVCKQRLILVFSLARRIHLCLEKFRDIHRFCLLL